MVSVFVLLVVIDLHRQRFEVYTFVSEINYNVDMVKGNKNVYEIEKIDSTRDSYIHFMNILIQENGTIY